MTTVAVLDNSRKWWTLGALTFSLFVIMIDNTVVTVALPAMQEDLGLSLSQLEWIVNAYTLTFAVLLLAGGKLADFLGRRRIFVAGLVIFTLSSLGCALSTSGHMLIGGRVAQGVGAALMLPATLSIISATFRPEERGTAIGIWAGVSGGALAIGPLVGGLLVDAISWPWIFYINLPFGVIGVASAFVFVSESRDTSAEQRLDVPGLVAGGLAVFGITYGLIEGNSYGWTSAKILGAFALGIFALAAFIVLERRQRLPVVDLSLFRNPTFAGANAVGLLNFTALFGFIVFGSIYLQNVLGYSPTKAGATFLASTLAIMVASPIGGKLADTIGPRLPAATGMLLFGIGMLGLSRVQADWSFWNLFPWLAVGGFGFGLVLPPATAAVLGSVPTEKSGVASGVMQSLRQLGGGLGVAVTGAVVASHLGSLTPADRDFEVAFMDGLQIVFLLCAAAAFLGSLIAALTLRRSVHK